MSQDAHGFLCSICVQAAEQERDPVFVLHCNVARHVVQGTVNPPVIFPFVERLLKVVKDLFTWGVGGKRCNKVSIVDKAESHKMLRRG